MKAQVLCHLKQPLVEEERAPLVASADQAVVRLRSAALNRRDFWITQGMYPGVKLPVVLGSDGTGEVTSVGSGVDSTWIGKPVLINPGLQWGENQSVQSDAFNILGMPSDGTFAGEVLVSAAQLFIKPDHLDWHQAAALPLAGVTAYRALFSQGALQAGQRVLVSGVGGGVATFALQFAVAAGAAVVVTSSSDEKLARAAELGATATYNYREDDWHKRLLADHGTADLIIDSAGGDGYKQLIGIASPGGRIVSYGSTAGPPEFDLFKVFWKQLHVIGSTMGSPADFRAMLEFVEQHRITPAIDSVRPLSEVNEALACMKESSQFGKLVLEIDP